MNQFKKTISQRSNLYNEYTLILNSLLGLTNKQVLVLSKLFELNDITSNNKSLLNKDNRREIEESCSIDECNLSTYLKIYKSKNILVKEGSMWKLYSGIKPLIYNNKIEIVFQIDIQ